MRTTVLGLGFGDEGKGLTTNHLCLQMLSQYDAIVIRFSGGQQAGHTVVKGEDRHVFSNFGSGTLAGVATYWSKYCTFEPVGFVNEYERLKVIMGDKMPTIYIDNASPVTTPYEIFTNQMYGTSHGTCGVGVGATFAREEKFHSILFSDLFFDDVLRIKMSLNADRYTVRERDNIDLTTFYEAVEKIRSMPNVRNVDKIPDHYSNRIFEGSQGLLLDQNIGFFPHVTRSNTDITNIEKMGEDPGRVYFVTRAYQTRHGNGPMTNENLPHNIQENPNETNVTNLFQGRFRKSLLDMSLLKYSINRNPKVKSLKRYGVLVITCLDQVYDEWRFTYDGKIHCFLNEQEFVHAIAHILEIDEVLLSHSDNSEKLSRLETKPSDNCVYRKDVKEFWFK